MKKIDNTKCFQKVLKNQRMLVFILPTKSFIDVDSYE